MLHSVVAIFRDDTGRVRARLQRALRLAAPAFLIASITGACAYTGGYNPIERKLTWFSYLDGDDLRERCRAGAPDAARFVYNAVDIEQIRTYDLQAEPRTGEHRLTARVIGEAKLSKLSLGSGEGLMAPWQGEIRTTILGDTDLDVLWRALKQDDAFRPLEARLHLQSWQFYWLVAVCRDGAFAYKAYKWPSPAFQALSFPNLLFAWDMTGVPVNQPRQTSAKMVYGDRKSRGIHSLTVGPGGLVGVDPVFE